MRRCCNQIYQPYCYNKQRKDLYVQLYDQNFINLLMTNNSFLNLSNEGILPPFTSGGFTLTSTQAMNDTLCIMKPGIYEVSLSIETSFALADPPPLPGIQYIIQFDLVNGMNMPLTTLTDYGNVPDNPVATINANLNRTFLINAPCGGESLRLRLTQFLFSIALNQTLMVPNLALVVESK